MVLEVVHDNLAAVDDPSDRNIHVGPGDAVVHADVGNLEAGFVLPVEFSTVLLP